MPDFAVVLEAPGLVTRIDAEDGALRLRGREFYPRVSAWSAFPDLLVEPQARTLEGLLYYFAPNADGALRSAMESWDTSFFRVVEAGSAEARVRFPEGFDTGRYLEVSWSRRLTSIQELAQLDFSYVNWLWQIDAISPGGIIVHDLGDLEQDYNVHVSL